MSEVSDAWQKGFETANSAVQKLADKELAKLRAENERLRSELQHRLRGLLKEWYDWQRGNGECIDLPYRTEKALKQESQP